MTASKRWEIPRRASRICLSALVVAVGCSSGPRLYYLKSELRHLEGLPEFVVAPGPWKTPDIPIIAANQDEVPDALVISVLQALMRLPGAADACDPNTDHPRRDATEYCVAIYKTPKDWRATWPVRLLVGEEDSCPPPYGGVDDVEFGSDLPIFGFAHDHPCGTSTPSSLDLKTFPWLKQGEGIWFLVSYAAAPGGRPAFDSSGKSITAWAWLAAGHADKPRYYKWNRQGEAFGWNPDKKSWEFRAICKPQWSNSRGSAVLPAKCDPELR